MRIRASFCCLPLRFRQWSFPLACMPKMQWPLKSFLQTEVFLEPCDNLTDTHDARIFKGCMHQQKWRNIQTWQNPTMNHCKNGHCALWWQVLLKCFRWPSWVICWHSFSEWWNSFSESPKIKPSLMALPFKSPSAAQVLPLAQLHRLLEFFSRIA